MGIAARDIPVTREDIYGWLEEWQALPPRRPAKRQFLADHIDEKYGEGTADTQIDTTEHDSYPNEMTVLEMVWDDLESYA